MAYGFRHVPARRQAAEPEPGRCPLCNGRLDVGLLPHFCKEVTHGTAVVPTATIPLADAPH